jgi:hypothetical protein
MLNTRITPNKFQQLTFLFVINSELKINFKNFHSQIGIKTNPIIQFICFIIYLLFYCEYLIANYTKFLHIKKMRRGFLLTSLNAKNDGNSSEAAPPPPKKHMTLEAPVPLVQQKQPEPLNKEPKNVLAQMQGIGIIGIMIALVITDILPRCGHGLVPKTWE